LLWGEHAKSKIKLIDQNKHYIISSSHPSPLSAHNGFLGSKPFSKTNNFLKQHNKAIINW
jgi:uracil-DNA glycosylase